MLFSNFLPSLNPDPLRLALLDEILLDFQMAFPDLHFELRLDRRVINAQAILLKGRRCVLVYGGLGLHPKLGEDSLTFVFLHEAGHHLALGPRLPSNASLACDCAADHWAIKEGATLLQESSGRQLQTERALSELDSLLSARQELAFPYDNRTTTCWNGSWLARKHALEGALGSSSRVSCELMTAK
jgi:hypothetical protein